MDVFRADGHLTDEALALLVQDGDMDELARLEAAEHLSFCDWCLQRYTDALAGTELLIPEHSCQKTIWTRIRNRAFRMITSRYATAIAAVALALTLIWGGDPAAFSERLAEHAKPRDYRAAELFDGWTAQWNDTLSQTMAGVSDFLDGLGRMDLSQGGNQT